LFAARSPLGYVAGDTNLYRYVSDDPTDASDPSGMAAEEKSASEATPAAAGLVQILNARPQFIAWLKQVAKNTGTIERFGAVLKAKDPNVKPELQAVECVSKKSLEEVDASSGGKEPLGAKDSPRRWWGCVKEHGAYLPKPGADGKIDLDAGGKLDRDYTIEYDWHTHPQAGDGWPSAKDGADSYSNSIVGVMIRYIGRPVAGKIEDDWAIWIIDKDGKTFEYKPPQAAGK
jgi:hypothetical protein